MQEDSNGVFSWHPYDPDCQLQPLLLPYLDGKKTLNETNGKYWDLCF